MPLASCLRVTTPVIMHVALCVIKRSVLISHKVAPRNGG